MDGLNLTFTFYEPTISGAGSTRNSKIISVSNDQDAEWVFHHVGFYYRLTAINSGYVQIPVPVHTPFIPFQAGQAIVVEDDSGAILFSGYVREASLTRAVSGNYSTVVFTSGLEMCRNVSFMLIYNRLFGDQLAAQQPVSRYFEVLMNTNYLCFEELDSDLDPDALQFNMPTGNVSVYSVLLTVCSTYGRTMFQMPDGTVKIRKLSIYDEGSIAPLVYDRVVSYSFKDTSINTPTRIINTWVDTYMVNEDLISSEADISIYRDHTESRADSWTMVRSMSIPSNQDTTLIPRFSLVPQDIPGYTIRIGEQIVIFNPLDQLKPDILRSSSPKIYREFKPPEDQTSLEVLGLSSLEASVPNWEQIRQKGTYQTVWSSPEPVPPGEGSGDFSTSDQYQYWLVQNLYSIATQEAAKGYTSNIRYVVTDVGDIPPPGSMVELPEGFPTAYGQSVFLVFNSTFEYNASNMIVSLELLPLGTLLPNFKQTGV